MAPAAGAPIDRFPMNTVPQQSRRRPWGWLLGIVLLMIALIAGVLVASILDRRAQHEEAERLWSRVEGELHRLPDRGTVDVGFETAFPDREALLDWAAQGPGSRSAIAHSFFGTDRSTFFAHHELLDELLAEPGLGPEELKAVERAAGEFRRSAILIEVLSCCLLADDLLIAVDEGRLDRELLADLEILPELEDIRLAFLVEAVTSWEAVRDAAASAATGGQAIPFLEDDLDAFRLHVAERTLAAVDADDFLQLKETLAARENDLERKRRSPSFWTMLFGDQLLDGLVHAEYARVIERLIEAHQAWEAGIAH